MSRIYTTVQGDMWDMIAYGHGSFVQNKRGWCAVSRH